MSSLYRVVTPHLVAGLIVGDGVVRRAAPILTWTVGQTVEAVRAWAERRGGSVERIT